MKTKMSEFTVYAKHLLLIFVIPAFLISIGFAEQPPGVSKDRIEFSFTIGAGKPGISSTSEYSDSGSYYLITNFQERSTLTAPTKSAVSFRGSIAYYASPAIGVELSIGRVRTGVTPSTSFNYDWRWSDGRSVQKRENWTGSGNLSILPISINIVGKLGRGSTITYVSGGYSLYSNNFEASSSMGMVVNWISYYYRYGIKFTTHTTDGLKIPVEINESWSSSGFNIGAGMGIQLNGGTSLYAEARYYYCPPRHLKWNYLEGTYQGLYTDYSWIIGNEATSLYESDTTPLEVNPSFFNISAGIRFRF
jgi:opacity protein-like surface antigen